MYNHNELNVSKNGNHSSYFPENVGRFNLSNRTWVRNFGTTVVFEIEDVVAATACVEVAGLSTRVIWRVKMSKRSPQR